MLQVNTEKIRIMEDIILKNRHIYPIDEFLKIKRGNKGENEKVNLNKELKDEGEDDTKESGNKERGTKDRRGNKGRKGGKERELSQIKVNDEIVVDIIVKTILSQNTSDKLRDIAFERLKGKYRNLMDLVYGDEKEIKRLISVCGLPNVKTKRIKNALIKIKEELRKPSDLCKMGKDKAFRFLTSINGIGPKSAEVILAFACGYDTFPVDTHVSRIIRRLGISLGTREKIHKIVSPHIENKILTHIFLIHHGRSVCRAKNPKCSICIFKNICDYHLSQMALHSTR